MGKKLQMAYLLLAEGKLTDDEVAARLGVRRRTLEEAKQRPYFERRIEEIRSVISRSGRLTFSIDQKDRISANHI
jgi:hypothetical protein